ncbi:SDR family oxidoreductase [Arthrobacter castelli]|uniref:SDR family oxidoreductase n=1 Tax=Arthrobacter castelli TaxID=271431 RepID=UPI000421DB41|nr:SDR family oxidoreductase [Arthrobacter castelli]
MKHTTIPASGTILITGGGSGIGRASAHGFLDAGWTVVLAGRGRPALDETAEDHPHAHVIPADITDPADVERLFDYIGTEVGRLDVLFNNAGTFGPAGAVDEIPMAAWEQTVSVNLTGSMLCAAAAVRLMKAQQPQGGRIINNGSISAHAPRPLSAAYTTTKHAITGLTKSIELDGRPYGISCGQIDIGNAATALMENIGSGPGALQPDGTRRTEPTFPVEEAAEAVLFMAQLPPSASVGTMVITASGMPFIGRG